MHIRSLAGHVVGITFQAVLVAAIVAALAFGAALVTGSPSGGSDVLAGRGGRTSGASVAVPDTTFGATATATVSGASGLYVRVACTQGGSTALVAWERTDAANQATFTMGPTPSWQSGSAACTADAGYFDNRGRFQVSASTSFAVSG